MSITTLPTAIVEAEINDGMIRLRVLNSDVVKLVEILKLNNAKTISIKAEKWDQWPREPLGTFPDLPPDPFRKKL